MRQMSGEGEGGDGMMKALSKITGQAKALKFAMDLAKKLSGNFSRSNDFEFPATTLALMLRVVHGFNML